MNTTKRALIWLLLVGNVFFFGLHLHRLIAGNGQEALMFGNAALSGFAALLCIAILANRK